MSIARLASPVGAGITKLVPYACIAKGLPNTKPPPLSFLKKDALKA